MKAPEALIDTSATRPRALLVGIQMHGVGPEEARELLDELGDLADTLGVDVADSLLVKLRWPQPRYLVGEGKAREIVERARASRADVVVFDDPLTPAQQRNWEALADRAVIDRQELILDIFASRAHTREASLQTALAQAVYSLPRLRRRWTHLNRQRGAAGGQGLRGEGEQQLELDARAVRARIARLEDLLEEVQKQRRVQRGQRQKKALPVAAIVGYTNAGKSSLLNALTETQVLVEDKLFATLDATVRRRVLPNRQEILLVDTVGFIRKLPHQLVEAFRSTLEEACLADFLIEVLDAASSQLEAHRATTRAVLEEIGAGDKPVLTVLNKIDLVPDGLARRRLQRAFPEAMPISTRTGEGLGALVDALAREAAQGWRERDLLVPHDRFDVVALLRRRSAVLAEAYDETGIRLRARVPADLASAVARFELPLDAPEHPASVQAR